MSEAELKPCPFCGSPPHFGHRGLNAGANVIECNNKSCPCLPFTNALSHSEAITAWNTRVADRPAARQSAVAALIAALEPFAEMRADDGDTFASYPPQVVFRCEVTAGEIQAARAALAKAVGNADAPNRSQESFTNG